MKVKGRVSKYAGLLFATLLFASILANPIVAAAGATGPSTAPGAYFDHVLVVIMEDHGMQEICGRSPPPCLSTAGAPYMAGLANSFSIGSHYLGVTHYSQADYLALLGADTDGCSSAGCPWPFAVPNLVDRLEAGGLSWKGYIENQNVASGCDTSYHEPYTPEHNPFVGFTDIANSPARCSKVVLANPSSCSVTDCPLINDLNSQSAPNFMWLTPNNCDNMHGVTGICPTSISIGDSYLSSLVPNILQSYTFTNTRAALFVVFDEGNGYCPLNNSHEDCVYAVWAGPLAKTNFVTSNLYNHYSFTKTIEANWNLPSITSNDAGATPLNEFFAQQPPSFGLTANPQALTVYIGSSNTSSITLSSLNGFSGNISLSSSISPAGPSSPSIFLSPNSSTLSPGSSASSILTVSTGNQTALGSYNVTVTGRSAGLSQPVIVPMKVVPQKNYALLVSSDGRVFKYSQDGTMTLIGRPVSSQLREVAWKPDGTSAVIVGDGAVLLTYNGVSLTRIPTNIAGNPAFYTISWKPDGSYALIGGQAGVLLKYDGTTLTQLPNTNTNNLRSISWNPDGNSALLVGDKGTALLYRASGSISVLPTGTGQPLFAVSWDPSGAYALAGGGGGVILRYNGTAFKALSITGLLPTGKAVRFISFGSGQLAVIVGDSGLLWTFDGSKLTSLASGTTQHLYSSSWLNGSAYIVGQKGTILSYSNGVVRKLSSAATSDLNGVGWKPIIASGIRASSTAVSCSPSTVAVSVSTTCTVTVADTSGTPTTPTGWVTFNETGAPGSLNPSSCTLANASCSVTFTPSSPGNATITGVYSGDSSHISSSGKTTLTANKRSTSTAVACVPSSVAVGQSTSCSASVTDISPGNVTTPTGTVTFTPGGTCTLVSGSCSVSLTPTTAGTVNVSATYGGDSTHGPSVGGNAVTANKRVTGTSISCSPNPVSIGQSATCTATATDSSPGTVSTPSGTVSFTSNGSGSFTGSPCNLVPGAVGAASCSVNYTPSGIPSRTDTITGVYDPSSSDTVHNGSQGTFSLSVGFAAVDPTSTSVACSPSSVVIGQATACTATVTDTASIGATQPTGTVTFTPGSSCSLGNPSGSSASCSVTITPTSEGSLSVSASYAGDTTHGSSSGNTSVQVNKRATSTTISCSPGQVTVNGSSTCTATVTDIDVGTASTPTGGVSFGSNSTGTFAPATSCSLVASATTGISSCQVTYTPITSGHHLLSATYAGDPSHSGSSNSFNLGITPKAPTTTSISCSPSSPLVNQATSCTATVTDTSGGAAKTPTGSVSFTTNSTGTFAAGGSCTLAVTGTVGVATCSVNYTPGVAGGHNLVATYAGDPGHTGSSGTATLTVAPQPPPPPSYALVISYEGKVFKFQNGSFTLIGQPVTTPLRELAWKPDGSYALIVGDSGVLLKYDGTQLTTIPTGITANIYSVAWRPDGSYALIAGSGGPLFKYDGVLTRLANPYPNSIRSISWNPSGTQAVLVGSSGGILLYQSSNGGISQISSGTTAYLYSSAWNPNGAYALLAGENGVILRYDGTSVTALNTAGLYNSTDIIHAISWNPSGTTALLVGDMGVILTYDGNQLTRMQSPASSNFYSISWLGSTAYITGGSGPSLTYTGGTLSTLSNSTGTSLRGWAWKPN